MEVGAPIALCFVLQTAQEGDLERDPYCPATNDDGSMGHLGTCLDFVKLQQITDRREGEQ